MSIVYISLGTNIGDRVKNLKCAKKQIEKTVGKIAAKSSIYETSAWGFKSEDLFYNQVIMVETGFLPADLLCGLQNIEKKMGRTEKSNKIYKSRIIDIDILFYDNLIINDNGLTIPHKFIHKRKFELLPMSEIAPCLIHPVLNKTIHQLLGECRDEGEISKLSKN